MHVIGVKEATMVIRDKSTASAERISLSMRDAAISSCECKG